MALLCTVTVWSQCILRVVDALVGVLTARWQETCMEGDPGPAACVEDTCLSSQKAPASAGALLTCLLLALADHNSPLLPSCTGIAHVSVGCMSPLWRIQAQDDT